MPTAPPPCRRPKLGSVIRVVAVLFGAACAATAAAASAAGPATRPASGPAAAGVPRIANGSMTDGAGKPARWADTWVADGEIEVTRDTATFRSGPAALSVRSVGGPARGHAVQFVDAKPGDAFHLAGHVRADGKATALLGAQAYTADWKGIAFTPIGNAVAGAGWREVGADVALPPGTARVGIVLMIEGDGTAWLDDVGTAAAKGTPAVAGAGRAGDGTGGAGTGGAGKPKVEPPPKAPDSVTPAEGFYPDYPHAWRQVVSGQVERAKKGDIDVVFLGDSLTQAWSEQPAWRRAFEPARAVNFGVGGDGTPQVLWRIREGVLDGYEAKLVVLMIGINNTWPGYSAEDTVAGIKKVVGAVRAKQPRARVLVQGVLPIFDKDDGIRQRIRTINETVARSADGRDVRFVDFGPKFLTPDGSRVTDLYAPDRLHLSAKGYEAWAAELEPIVREMAK